MACSPPFDAASPPILPCLALNPPPPQHTHTHDTQELGYKKWAGSGGEPEHNVFGKGYQWPDY